jgi:hypothetical protein
MGIVKAALALSGSRKLDDVDLTLEAQPCESS